MRSASRFHTIRPCRSTRRRQRQRRRTCPGWHAAASRAGDPRRRWCASRRPPRRSRARGRRRPATAYSILRERGQHDALERRRRFRLRTGHRRRRLGSDRRDQTTWLALARALPGDHLVDISRPRESVRESTGRLRAARATVRNRADDRPSGLSAVPVDCSRAAIVPPLLALRAAWRAEVEQLTPDSVSMMLLGLMSRWVMLAMRARERLRQGRPRA